jgi:hypothetical protein
LKGFIDKANIPSNCGIQRKRKPLKNKWMIGGVLPHATSWLLSIKSGWAKYIQKPPSGLPRPSILPLPSPSVNGK